MLSKLTLINEAHHLFSSVEEELNLMTMPFCVFLL